MSNDIGAPHRKDLGRQAAARLFDAEERSGCGPRAQRAS
jgi:hypothetical protein